MPESRVWVDTRPDGLQLTLLLPLNRLELAVGSPLADAPDTVLLQHGDALSRYLLQHVGVRSQGVGWQVLRPQLAVNGRDGNAELQVVMRVRAPAGADPRSPVLHYDVITHEVLTHRVLVAVRNDWEAGQIGDAPRWVGELHHGKNSQPLPLDDERFGASVLRLTLGGAWHIAEGSDHLLFLLMLLLVAPLRANQHRWQAPKPAREALTETAWVITAFTLGHTLTLVLGSLQWLAVPAQQVEVAVALTVGLAAGHAWRPWFNRAEAVTALLFGLIHGLAFSASLSGAGLTRAQHALALLAFNLGIELAQLALLLAVLPPLMLLARMAPRCYRALRQTLATLALACAGWWTLERLGVLTVPDGPWADALTMFSRWMLVPLWLLAAWAWWRANRSNEPPASLSAG